MSEMTQNKGVIKQIGVGKTLNEIVDELIAEDKVQPEDIDIYEDKVEYIGNGNYAVIGDRVFDVSNAPDEYGMNEDRYNVQRISDTELEIDLYYYNGGGCLEDIVGEWLINEEKSNAKIEPDFIPETSQLVKYAEEELKRAGLLNKNSDYDGMLGEAALEIVKVFSKQGHSGYSAETVTQIVEKLMRYEPLTPLTYAPDEWNDVSKESGSEMWQNRRKSTVFSTDGGKTHYDINERK